MPFSSRTETSILTPLITVPIRDFISQLCLDGVSEEALLAVNASAPSGLSQVMGLIWEGAGGAAPGDGN